MTAAFALQIVIRQASQLVVDDGHQFLERFPVPAAPPLQQLADVPWAFFHALTSLARFYSFFPARKIFASQPHFDKDLTLMKVTAWKLEEGKTQIRISFMRPLLFAASSGSRPLARTAVTLAFLMIGLAFPVLGQ